MSRRIALLAGALVWLNVTPLCAQDPVPQEIYGTAVHAYFSCDYRRTFDLLTPLIEAGTADPRPYYFRGLALLHLGREDEAKRDFQRGAKLESKDPDQTRSVSKSLERIQGSARMLLEQYRAEARLLAFRRSEELRKARYEAIRREERRVLQQQAEGVPTPKPIPPPPESPSAEGAGVKPVPPPEKKPVPTEPQGSPFEATKPATPPAKTPPPPPEPEGNPFESAKPAPGAAPSPGTPAKPPAGAAAAPPAGAGDDLLGQAINALGVKTPAGSAPSGAATPPGAAGTTAKKPPAGAVAGDSGDLFAPPVKKPAAEAAAEGPDAKTPAGDEENPFGAPGAAKGKSAAKKPSTTGKSAAKKPAAKEPSDADSGNPFGGDPSGSSPSGKKTGT